MDIYIFLLVLSLAGIVVLSSWLIEALQAKLYDNISVYLTGITLSVIGLLVSLKDILN